MSIESLFDISSPIFALPSPFFATEELVAEISEKGGLGVFPAMFLEPEEIEAKAKRIRELTSKPFGFLLCPPQREKLDPEKADLWKRATQPLRDFYDLTEPNLRVPDFEKQLHCVADLEVPVVGTMLGGLREPYMELLESKNIKTFGVASNLLDAKVLQSSGVNALVAKGWETGGLVSNFETPVKKSFVGSSVLLDEMARAMRIPVLACVPGLSDRMLDSALVCGAKGFALTDDLIGLPQSAVNPDWLELLRYTNDGSSQVSSLVYGHPSRVLTTTLLEELEEAGIEPLPFPYQWHLMKDIFSAARKAGSLQDFPMDFGQAGYEFFKGDTESLMRKLAGKFHK